MTEPTTGNTGFSSLDLDDRLIAALTALGYEEPTPIQREAIPPLLDGKDLLGQAATGTGKTAAFALPMLQRVCAERAPRDEDDTSVAAIRGLVLVPTRELAMQVAEAVHKYGKGFGVRVAPIYGGQAIGQQLRQLRRGADVVIATPGRMVDHLSRGSIDLSSVRLVVLDEADEMLDMGFAEDLETILTELPEERQTALFSATMAPRVASIAERHLREPVRVTIARERTAPGEVPRVRQTAYVVQRQNKVPALGRILDMEAPTSAIVFCRTRTEVDELTETLTGRGYQAEALHGGLNQDQRDRVMRRFRAGTTELLIATDVAARGLDVEHLSHVVNYDVPNSPDVYVHRIGRTGRAGREGVAITLVEPREQRLLRNIEHLTRQKFAVETVPTVADLRARRLELTRSSISEALVEGDFEAFRIVIESLSAEHDILDIAAAAVKVAHEATEGSATEDEADIPQIRPDATRSGERGRERPRRDRFEERGPRRERGADRGERPERGPRGEFGGREERGGRYPVHGDRADRPRRGTGRVERGDVSRVYVGIGRMDGMRPADLVGAIANEAGLDSREIGAIEIADKFSLVEVPTQAVGDVVEALRSTTLRGKRVQARPDRGPGGGEDRPPRKGRRS